jgi:hypothetical protein
MEYLHHPPGTGYIMGGKWVPYLYLNKKQKEQEGETEMLLDSLRNNLIKHLTPTEKQHAQNGKVTKDIENAICDAGVVVLLVGLGDKFKTLYEQNEKRQSFKNTAIRIYSLALDLSITLSNENDV